MGHRGERLAGDKHANKRPNAAVTTTVMPAPVSSIQYLTVRTANSREVSTSTSGTERRIRSRTRSAEYPRAQACQDVSHFVWTVALVVTDGRGRST